MIYDILEVFKKEYEKSGDRLILGKYELKDGLYVRINREGKPEYFEAKTVKKEKLFTTIDGRQDSQAHSWFKEVDYYSSYLNSNKALFDKKIHNINYLSFYFKAENHEYVKVKIRDHFLTLLSFKKFKDKNEKEVLASYEDRLKSFSRKRDIVKKYRSLENSFDEIVLKSKELKIKNYVKIFFEEDLEFYKNESDIYLSLKIFNDSKYNKKVLQEIYGLSNANMGLNSKKPFLENKSRKVSVPFFVESNNALVLKKFFDWLKLQSYSQDRYLDEHFFMQKQSKNDEAEIKEFDYIPLKKDDVQRHFKTIEVKNYLKIRDKDGQLIQDYEITKLFGLEEEVNDIFYNKQLIFNYYKDSQDVKVSNYLSTSLQNILLISRYGMFNYFKKFDKSSFITLIEKYGTDFVINHIKTGAEFKAKKALNLKFSILENQKKEGEKMDFDVIELENRMIKKLEESDYTTLNKEEFFYLSGQIARYLLSLNRGFSKKHDLVEPFLRANHAQKLKKVIETTFFQYKHALYLEAKKINNAILLVMAYTEDERLQANTDTFLIGYLSSTKIFKSNDEGEE